MPVCKRLERHVQILGTGHAVPTQVLTSEALDHRLQQPQGTIERISGVVERRFARSDEHAALFAGQACRKAMTAAGVTLADIDCLVAASATMDQAMPCNGVLIHRELGLSESGIPTFDINASCLSFLAAMDVLAWAIHAGRYQCVLLVASDIASCGLNWNTLDASAIFGDGAAAVVLGPSPAGHPCIRAAALRTISSGADFCQIPAGGSRHHPSRVGQQAEQLSYFSMNGKSVFKLAAEHLPAFVEQLLSQAHLRLEQIDWVVPHQASHLALIHLSKRLGFAQEKVINIFADHGNQLAASMPTALDIAIRDGRIRHGHRVLLLGTGAGLSLGGVVMEY